MEIEKLATAAVTTLISKTDCLSPFISEGDKEPSWDGNIYIFSKNQKRKEDLIGRISVQVKGKISNKPINKSKYKYHVNISDLRNYEVYGIVYFVVFIDDNRDTHIYYNLFYPVDIKRILSRVGKQKGTNIEFSIVPPYSDITAILINFKNDCDKQVSFVKNPNFNLLNINKISISQQPVQFSVSCSGKSPNSIFKYVLTNEVFLYAKSPIPEYPNMPIDKISVQKLEQTIEDNVEVDDVVYYHKYTKQLTKDKFNIYLGECIIITIDNKELCTININLNNKLKEQIIAIEFIIRLSQSLTLKLGGYELKLNKKNNINTKEQKELLSYLQNIQKSLDILNVKEDLIIDYDKFEDNYRSALNILVNVLVHKKHYNNKKWSHIQRLNMQIFNIYLPLIFIKGENTESDTFINVLTQNPNVTISLNNKQEIPVSQHILLDQNDYQFISCIYYNSILQSLTSYGNYTPLIEKINISLLNMLSAYDMTNKKELLDLCLSISDWLLLNGDTLSIEIRQLNKLQTLKRKRVLNNEERCILQKIAERNEDNNILTAVYLLLDETDKAMQYYDRIEKKEEFNSFPIYSFMKAKRDGLIASTKK